MRHSCFPFAGRRVSPGLQRGSEVRTRKSQLPVSHAIDDDSSSETIHWQKNMDELKHYCHGFWLLFIDVKIS